MPGSAKFLGNMDEWMRDQEKRMTSVERRKRRLGDSGGGGGGTIAGFNAVAAESADRAVQFIKSMMLPSTRIVSDAKIRPDVVYPPDYIGPVTGTYDIPMSGEPTTTPTPLVVGTPVGFIPDAYRGLVYGSLNIAATSGMTVKTYKRSDTDYEMPTVGTVDPATGFWNLDLSTTPDWQAGQWVFALLKDGVQVGEKWPYPKSYTNIKVENRVITDTSYLVGTPGTQPAQIDGRFRFTYTLNGRKHFRLTRPNGDILAEYAPLTGCARSYLVQAGEPGYGTQFINQTYGYDQAVTLLAMIAAGERETAAQLARGMLRLQTPSGTEVGGFIFSGSQMSPEYGDPAYRTGAHCFCVYALIAYVQAWPNDTGQDFTGSITRGMAWLDRYLSGNGLYLGGKGTYTSSGGFEPATPITWAAAEHNFDAWHLWDLAYKTFHNATYQNKANAVKNAIMTQLWRDDLGRFLQGMGPGNVPDTGDPLDCHSWGAMFLMAIGESAKASQIMTDAQLAPFKFTINGLTGYAPAYAADPAYPDATPTVWSEGTFGVALAFLAIADRGRWHLTMQQMMAGQEPDGSYRYVSVRNVPYEWTNSKAVIGGAWSIMALGGHGIWSVEATPLGT
ncbi:MAG: hypothetical protein ABWZ30_05530 [Jiangellaceae bacterium]